MEFHPCSAWKAPRTIQSLLLSPLLLEAHLTHENIGEQSGWDTASGLLVQAEEGKAVHFKTLGATPIIFKIPVLLSICPQMYVSSWTFCSLLILSWVVIYFPLSRYRYTLKDSVCVCVCVCVCVRERERERERDRPEQHGLVCYSLCLTLLFNFHFFSGSEDTFQTTKWISVLSGLLESWQHRQGKLI